MDDLGMIAFGLELKENLDKCKNDELISMLQYITSYLMINRNIEEDKIVDAMSDVICESMLFIENVSKKGTKEYKMQKSISKVIEKLFKE